MPTSPITKLGETRELVAITASGTYEVLLPSTAIPVGGHIVVFLYFATPSNVAVDGNSVVVRRPDNVDMLKLASGNPHGWRDTAASAISAGNFKIRFSGIPEGFFDATYVAVSAVAYHMNVSGSIAVSVKFPFGSTATCGGDTFTSNTVSVSGNRALLAVHLTTWGNVSSPPAEASPATDLTWTPDASKGFTELDRVQYDDPVNAYQSGSLVESSGGPIIITAEKLVNGGSHSYAGELDNPICGASGDFWSSQTWVIYATYSPNTRSPISVALSPTRRRLRPYVDPSGALKIDRYNDASPPAVLATSTLEASDVTGVHLVWATTDRGRPRPELVYAKRGTVYERQSKDGGRTWTVADTIATGYQDVLSAIDWNRGIKVVLLYKESEQKWYATVGRRKADASGWEYPTAPAVIVSNAKAGGCLIRTPARRYEFDYTTTADVPTTVRCKKLSVASAGVWS